MVWLVRAGLYLRRLFAAAARQSGSVTGLGCPWSAKSAKARKQANAALLLLFAGIAFEVAMGYSEGLLMVARPRWPYFPDLGASWRWRLPSEADLIALALPGA